MPGPRSRASTARRTTSGRRCARRAAGPRSTSCAWALSRATETLAGGQRGTNHRGGPRHAGAGGGNRPLQGRRPHRALSATRRRRRKSGRTRPSGGPRPSPRKTRSGPGEIACQAMAEMGEPHLPNGVADTTVRRTTRATAMRMVTLLLTTSRSEGDKAHLERSLQLALMVDGEDEGSEDSEDIEEATSEQVIRSIESNVVDCLRRESPDDPARLKLARGPRSTQGQRPAGTVLAGPGSDADAAEAAQGPDRRRPRPALRPPLLPRRRRGLAGSHRLPGGRRGEGPDAVRHGDGDADRRRRDRAGRRGPRDAAGPRRGPAAGRPVEPAAARAARRGQGAYGRGAGGATNSTGRRPTSAASCARMRNGSRRRSSTARTRT